MKPMNIIVELAGRDSVVAFYRLLKQSASRIPAPSNSFILSIVNAAPEYGTVSCGDPIDMACKLKKLAENYGQTVHEVATEYKPDIWFNMVKSGCLGYTNTNFISPCLMCHTYCHLMRLPIALKYGYDYILTGERSSHDGKLKVNQNEKVFKSIDSFFNSYGITLVRPLEHVENTEIIKKEYSDLCRELGVDENYFTFTPCYLEGSGKIDNQRDLDIFLANNLYKVVPIMEEMVKQYDLDTRK